MLSSLLTWIGSRRPARGYLSRLAKDSSGVGAVEFGLVATPFLMMMFGILGIGIYFFTVFSVESAIEVASRQIRTRDDITVSGFKTKVCGMVPNYVQCGTALHVSVQDFPDSAAITANSIHKCLDGNGNINATVPFDPGSAGNPIILVIACYEWELANILPFLKLGNMSNGSMLIQAATTFRIEPQ